LASAGCWEEIHYTPTSEQSRAADAPPAEPKRAAAPATSDATEVASPRPESQPVSDPEPAAGVSGTAIDEEAPAGDEPPPPDAPAEVPAAGSLPAEVPETSVAEEPSESPGGEAPSLAERRQIWQAVSQWSLAAAIYAKGLSASRYEPIVADADAAARQVGVGLPPLPTVSDKAHREATVIEALRGELAATLVGRFTARFTPAEGGIAELAIRSRLLLLTYSPRGADDAHSTVSLRQAAEASELPAEVWTPLVELVENRAPYTEVRTAVFELDGRVAKLTGK
jgi:hypothetical protein